METAKSMHSPLARNYARISPMASRENKQNTELSTTSERLIKAAYLFEPGRKNLRKVFQLVGPNVHRFHRVLDHYSRINNPENTPVKPGILIDLAKERAARKKSQQ